MKKIIFTFSILILLFSCKNHLKDSKNIIKKPNSDEVTNSKDNSQNNQGNNTNQNKEVSALRDLIIGRWKRNDDQLYSLDFKKLNTGEIECTFYNGGPFQEYLMCIFTDDKKIDLYFKYIAGTTSFMEMNNPSNKNSCKTKVITCSLIDENQLLINTSNDICGQIFEENDIKLTRVTE